MSRLENEHAKPAMERLIFSDSWQGELGRKQLAAIARFAFKSTVVANHMTDESPIFFSAFERRRFARALTIPDGIQMWFARLAIRFDKFGKFSSMYGKLIGNGANDLNFYTCTWCLGYLGIQVLATKWRGAETDGGGYRFPACIKKRSPIKLLSRFGRLETTFPFLGRPSNSLQTWMSTLLLLDVNG